MAPNALKTRLARVAQAAAARTQVTRFTLVVGIAVANADGLAPGLYPSPHPGSTAAILVFDPAAGPPAVPDDRMVPWGKLFVSEGATLDLVR